MAEPLKVGLAGLGTVGSAVVDLLDQGREKLIARCGRPIEVVALTARSRGKKRGFDLKKYRWFSDPVALARDPSIDVLVEVIGGAGDPAKAVVETALKAGKPVVTANKALLASHGQKLAAVAERQRVALNFEASVAGGIPIVKTLREGLNGASFTRIYGILNGTCNYMLTRMEQERIGFAECLRDAQRSAMPKPIRLSTSKARTPRKSSPSWQASLSAPRSIPAPFMSKAFRRFRSPISTLRASSATGSSCWASR